MIYISFKKKVLPVADENKTYEGQPWSSIWISVCVQMNNQVVATVLMLFPQCFFHYMWLQALTDKQTHFM